MPGTEVATILDIVILGQWRDHGCAAGDLANAVQDDLRASVVEFHGAVNLDRSTCQASDVSNVFQAGRKDHNCEGAGHLVFTKLEEVDSLGSNFDPEDLSGDATGFADMLIRFVNGDAIGGAEAGGDEQEYQNREES